MVSLRFYYSLFLFLFLNVYSGFSQKGPDFLHKKYSPVALRSDLLLFKNITLAMHPVIGIYKSRDYYEKLFDDQINSLNDSLTEKEFRIKCKLIVDELHCGHTEIMNSKASQKKIAKLKLNYSPYIFFPVQDKMYVIANLNKKQDSTVKKGTEVIKINGIGVDSMLNYCHRFISADGYNSTAKEHYIQLAFNNFFPSLFGRPDTFMIEYKEGRQNKQNKYAAMKVNGIPDLPLKAKDDSLFKTYKKAAMKYRYLDGTKKVMFLKVEKFSHTRYRRAYRKIFKQLEKNKSQQLVLDLRNNGGGSLANSYRLLSYLLDTAKTQTLRTGIKNYPYKKYTQGNLSFKIMRFAFSVVGKRIQVNDTDNYVYTIKPGKKHHFDQKIFVLINGGSFSASCLVAAYLKNSENTIFIGEESGGASEGCNAGITPYYTLPNTKLRVRIPAFRLVHDIAPLITGHGILPDYPTHYSFKDIASRKDLDLQKAMDLINSPQ